MEQREKIGQSNVLEWLSRNQHVSGKVDHCLEYKQFIAIDTVHRHRDR